MPQAEYVFRHLEPSENSLWDDFVRNTPGGSLFHQTKWAGIVSEVINRSFKILVVQKKDTIKGGILFWQKKIAMIKAITRIPFTPYQGILTAGSTRDKPSSQIAETSDIIKRILSNLREEYQFIDLTSNPADKDMRPYLWQNCRVTPAYTYTFPMQEETVRTGYFSQALRRKIAVSRKKGLEVLESDETDKLTDFIFESYRFHNTRPPLSRDQLSQFITRLLSTGLGKIYYLKDRTVSAGLLIVQDEKNAYALMSGMDRTERTHSFSEYLHAAVLFRPEFKDKQFDFLGANTEDFEQFKRSFGGSLQSYYYISYTRSFVVKLLQTMRKQCHFYRRRAI